MSSDPTPTTVHGLGEMGSALAAALIDAGHSTTVWNRSPAKARPLAARGATVAGSVEAAVTASPVIVACLFDHASVHEVLDPLAASLSGRALVNLTTTTPGQARELADWSRHRAIDYLDGGIMAVPEMIGGPGAAILYSGSAIVFDEHRALLDRWGQSSYVGADAGMASLYDSAMLAGMYTMFAGFLHGAAMVGSAGVSAGEGQQSLEFSDLTKIVTASVEQGVSAEVLQPVHKMIQRQIVAGHGKQGFARIFEEFRSSR